MTSATSAAVGSAAGVERGESLAVLGAGVLRGVDDRQRLLVVDDVGRFLAGRLFRAPDAEQVVVELEGEAERPAEAAIAGDDRLVGGRQERAGLDRGGDEGRRLAPDHVEVEIDADELVRGAHRDVDVLALAQRQAGLVEQAHQAQDRACRGSRGPVSRWRAMRDRLNIVSPVLIACGTPWIVHRVGRWRRSTSPSSMSSWTSEKLWPSSTAAAPGQRALVLAGDAGVGEQAEQRPHPLAARRTRPVECEVVADHLVEPVGRRIAVADEADDLALGVGDQGGEVDVRGRGRHRGPSVHETCTVQVA